MILALRQLQALNQKKNNGKYRYVWLLKGKFELTSDEYDTEAEKPQPKTAKLKGTFFARDFDANYRFIADEDSLDIDPTIISSWFTSVPEEPVETPQLRFKNQISMVNITV